MPTRDTAAPSTEREQLLGWYRVDEMPPPEGETVAVRAKWSADTYVLRWVDGTPHHADTGRAFGQPVTWWRRLRDDDIIGDVGHLLFPAPADQLPTQGGGEAPPAEVLDFEPATRPTPHDVEVRASALSLAVQSHGPKPGQESDACFTARARHFEAYLRGELKPGPDADQAVRGVVYDAVYFADTDIEDPDRVTNAVLAHLRAAGYTITREATE
jgi:hypothetical protein